MSEVVHANGDGGPAKFRADQLPPQDGLAEQAVIGAVLRDATVLPAVRAALAAADFYHHAHGLVFRRLCALADADRPVDVVAAHDALRASGEAAELGGEKGLVAWLTECWEAVPTAANAEYHAQIVRDHATRRRLIHALTECVRDAYDLRGRPVDDLLADAERRVLAVGDRLAAGGGPVSLDDALRDALARVDERAAGAGEAARVIPTGYAPLDGVIGGFRPGVLYVVAARPSVGKSAFALGCLLNAGAAGVRSLFVSLEMSAAELADRTLALRASVPLGRLTAGRFESADEPAQLLAAAGRPTGVWVDDRSDHTPESIAAAVRRAVARQKVGLVAVDYLQLVRHAKAERHHLAVGATAKSLKRLARQANVPVLCLAQLNREVEGRGADAKPRLSDLRDSGEIEQDADVVMFLHPGEVVPGNPVQPVEVLVEKQRNGPRGAVAMDYLRPFTRFEERPPV